MLAVLVHNTHGARETLLCPKLVGDVELQEMQGRSVKYLHLQSWLPAPVTAHCCMYFEQKTEGYSRGRLCLSTKIYKITLYRRPRMLNTTQIKKAGALKLPNDVRCISTTICWLGSNAVRWHGGRSTSTHPFSIIFVIIITHAKARQHSTVPIVNMVSTLSKKIRRLPTPRPYLPCKTLHLPIHMLHNGWRQWGATRLMQLDWCDWLMGTGRIFNNPTGYGSNRHECQRCISDLMNTQTTN